MKIREGVLGCLPGVSGTYNIVLRDKDTFMYFLKDYDEYHYRECGKSPDMRL